MIIHGGDSFAVRVEYLPSLQNPRYIWQRGDFWVHLSDQPSNFRPPLLLAEKAPPDAPILNPERGDAVDYLNPFHTSVGYWIPGSKAVIANTAHPVTRGKGLKLGDDVPGPWGGEIDIPYEPLAWDVLIRSDRAAPETREFGIDAYDPTPFHRVGLAVHKNLRLGLVSGENFPNILADPKGALFRELYRRTLHYFLDTTKAIDENARLASQGAQASNQISWDRTVSLQALRYELPEFIKFEGPDWHRKPAAFAHYVVEGSTDGEHWIKLADRTHGPWRGMQTDLFTPVEVRYVRFNGVFSDGSPFQVRNVQAFAGK